MKGKAKIIAIAVIIIFGTNVSVISCMEVADWKIEIITPIINAAPSIGIKMNSTVKNESLNNSITRSIVIMKIPLLVSRQLMSIRLQGQTKEF